MWPSSKVFYLRWREPFFFIAGIQLCQGPDLIVGRFHGIEMHNYVTQTSLLGIFDYDCDRRKWLWCRNIWRIKEPSLFQKKLVETGFLLMSLLGPLSLLLLLLVFLVFSLFKKLPPFWSIRCSSTEGWAGHLSFNPLSEVRYPPIQSIFPGLK